MFCVPLKHPETQTHIKQAFVGKVIKDQSVTLTVVGRAVEKC